MKGKAKILASVILVLTMVVGLCACGGGNGSSKGSGSLDLDYEGTDVAQEDQQEKQSGFQSWVNEMFSFGKKETDNNSGNGQEESSESGQTQQGGSSGQSSGSSGSQSGKNSYSANQGGQSANTGNSQSGQSSQGSQSGTQSGSSGSSGNKNQSGKNSSGSQSGQSGSQNGSGTQTQQGTQTSQQTGNQSGNGNQNNSGNSGNNQNTGNSSKKTVTITIRCDTAVNNGMHLESKWAGIVPASGVILPVTTVEIEDGQTVFDVLAYVCSKYKIHMSYRGGTGSGCYVDGINNLYEFDGGRWSGWMYCVNKWYPNYGCGVYYVKAGDVIEWNYTCDLGLDLEGGDMLGGQEWKDTHD